MVIIRNRTKEKTMGEQEDRIEVLIPQVLAEMRRIGASEASIWNHQRRAFAPIKSYFKKHRVAIYDEDLLAGYVEECEALAAAGHPHDKWLSIRLKGVDRLREFRTTGKLVWAFRPKGSSFAMNECHAEALAAFVDASTYTDNSKGDAIWAVRKYLSFMEGIGISGIDGITVDGVRRFIAFASRHLKAGSLNNVKGYIKAFHEYLARHGSDTPGCDFLLSCRSPREQKIAQFMAAEDVSAVLGEIDVGTAKGKRDYAVIMLAATTGMRAADIVNLRLKDINWAEGKIACIQSKTSEPLALPLVRAAGEAIEGYILDARPDAPTDHVFIRLLTPFMRISNPETLDQMLKEYQVKAGIERKPFDGKGFHSLRRAMGRNLVVSGTPISTVAQILGHAGPESARPYISLDTESLRQCAIGLDGIEPRGRYS
jgi:site-specific recombinase XerD